MIEPKDLRIGNYVEYRIQDELDDRKEWWELSIIDSTDLQILESGIDDDYRAIPLTEEWLFKFGFSNRLFLEDWFIKLNDDTILILKNPFYYYEVSVCNSNTKKTELNKIKYVHQLQNQLCDQHR